MKTEDKKLKVPRLRPEDLPCSCFKGELYDYLKPIPQRELTKTLLEIIVANRKIDITAARNVHVVRKNECRALLIFFGEIDG